MQYGIGPRFYSDKPTLAINEADYKAVITQRKRLSASLSLQEKYAYLVENYYELELEVFGAALRLDNAWQQPWEERIQITHTFMRRIINLFTTTRLYLDQAKSDLKRIDPSKQLMDEFVRKIQDAKVASFSFQLCEALRNHVQHAGLPLTGLRFDNRYPRSKAGPKKPISYVGLTLDRDGLLADRKLDDSLRTKLVSRPGQIDLRPLLKDYVCQIADINEWLHPKITHAMSDARTFINEKIAEYRTFAKPEDPTESVAAFEVVGDSDERKHTVLNTKIEKRFDQLYFRYRRISTMQYRVVSNEPHDADQLSWDQANRVEDSEED